MRTASSAAASGGTRRGSRSTTVAPSSQSTPGRTIVARSGASVQRIDVGRHGVHVGLRIGSNDSADSLAEFLRIESGQFPSVDGIVHDEPNGSWIRRQSSLQHHVTAADDGERNDGKAGLQGQEEAAALEARDTTITAASSLGKDDE